MVDFTGFIGSCVLGLSPGVIHLHKKGLDCVKGLSLFWHMSVSVASLLSFLMPISRLDNGSLFFMYTF